MSKVYIFLGSINAFLAVAFGAFGAHGLKPKLCAEMLAIYQTAVQYHMIHSIGLILVGIMVHRMTQSALINWAARLLLAGIVIFCGSLYVLSFTGIRTLGAITPFGGVFFLVGWMLLAIAALKGV